MAELKKQQQQQQQQQLVNCDWTEVYELVGLNLLGKLTPLIGTKNGGFYWDAVIAAIYQANGSKNGQNKEKNHYTVQIWKTVSVLAKSYRNWFSQISHSVWKWTHFF